MASEMFAASYEMGLRLIEVLGIPENAPVMSFDIHLEAGEATSVSVRFSLGPEEIRRIMGLPHDSRRTR